MDRAGLKAVQDPLKEAYRSDPEALVAEGELDARGTLGVDRDAPVGLTSIRLRADLDTDADHDQLATLMRLTERYCVVPQTLMSGAHVHMEVA